MPETTAPRRADEAGGAPRILTVTELTRLIKGTLEESFGRVWVEGEISGWKQAASGHAYFSLKDEGALIKAVMFRGRLQGVRFRPEDGTRVVATGQVSVYAPRGDYQVIVDTLEPRGVGALQLAFEQLKARLAAEGLFDEARKRPVPAMPATVGVVTSPTGAVIRDIIHVMRRRFASVRIVLAPVRVQGEGAAAEIAAAIADMNRWGVPDVLIVGRGGGSLEDLWAFNEEVVARAIAGSSIPVISAVGHETDFTIADFVADLRAPTPSAAAEVVVRNRVNLVRELRSLEDRLEGSMAGALARQRTRLEGLATRRVLSRPEVFLQVPRQRLDEGRQGLARVVARSLAERRVEAERLGGRLARFDPRERLSGSRRELASSRERLSMAVRKGLELRLRRLEAAGGRLDALSPLAVLGRGYSITRSVPAGRVITDASTVQVGDALELLLHRGRLDCRVEGIRGQSPNSGE